MRLNRLRKFKKRKKFLLLCKIVAICYGSIFLFSFLTSGTGAYFNSANEDQFTLQAGTWWDGSELEFIGNGNQNIKQCPPTELSVEIQNNGFTMMDSTKYEIYYIENGNPQQNGDMVAGGNIPPIVEGDVETITHEVENAGQYQFKAYQREDYKGDHHEIWSEKVIVKCNKNNKPNNVNSSQDEANKQDEVNKNEKDNDEVKREETVSGKDRNETQDMNESTDNEDNETNENDQHVEEEEHQTEEEVVKDNVSEEDEELEDSETAPEEEEELDEPKEDK
ncbi:amyloid fiber anchoring/assembly protein TapA [Oceanobacillus halotolerans]|uniref:amyloid fiber anchoring/assembly protein TapA n=1 Tax=Oceanobacillus halotolerans TaxID=2663380 RepID=UPI0013DA27A9|nr:amyloid fiber anchoring/assembly protein TapA [Oceanobacillus halotolerans]